MRYHFSNLASMADYLRNRATMFRESADATKSKQKRALLIERAATHENIADMIRKTTIGERIDDSTISFTINPQEK